MLVRRQAMLCLTRSFSKNNCVHPCTSGRKSSFRSQVSVPHFSESRVRVRMEAITYLGQKQAKSIDEELMGPMGFSIDQLMELAGLSVASAIAKEYPNGKCKRMLVIAGPGNNGGDGLVVARHLCHFGYEVSVCYPQPTEKPIYSSLVTQLTYLPGVEFVQWPDVMASGLKKSFDVVVDAMFGFSFKGAPRPPFDAILKELMPNCQIPPLVSIDIPSGWGVEDESAWSSGIQPDMLVSLTAPKIAAKGFKGRHHYLGGRFVPPALKNKFGLQLPEYPGADQCVKLNAEDAGPSVAQKVADMRISYERGGLNEVDFLGADPMKVWDIWFKEAVEGKVCEEPNAISLASADEAGRPSVRVVLLKGYDARGFMFYTNYSSRKGQELNKNQNAAFSVYWEKTQRQVRVEGTVEQLSEAESSDYFHSRPQGSQIGAWVSRQSEPLHNGRAELEERDTELKLKYSDASQTIPKPPHWGGYLIRPTRIEFWQGRPSRLHDRICFSSEGPSGSQQWLMQRLQP